MSTRSDRLRNQSNPSAMGYTLDRKTLVPVREYLDTRRTGDYGADPLENGSFRMIPSGDIVDFHERNRRLDSK